MTGLLLCGPVLASFPKRWPISKSFYGSGDDHMKGDVFRVVVQFSNESDVPLRDVSAKIFYPKEVIPYPKKIFQKKISKFPWPDHFVDEDNRVISFQYNFEISQAPVEFYSYFVADKYGVAEFEYAIKWLGPDSLYYRANSRGQEIILPDSIEYSSEGLQEISLRTKGLNTDTINKGRNSTKIAFIIGLVFLVGALIGAIVFNLIRKDYTIKELISYFEKENKCLQFKISKKINRLEKEK